MTEFILKELAEFEEKEKLKISAKQKNKNKSKKGVAVQKIEMVNRKSQREDLQSQLV